MYMKKRAVVNRRKSFQKAVIIIWVLRKLHNPIFVSVREISWSTGHPDKLKGFRVLRYTGYQKSLDAVRLRRTIIIVRAMSRSDFESAHKVSRASSTRPRDSKDDSVKRTGAFGKEAKTSVRGYDIRVEYGGHDTCEGPWKNQRRRRNEGSTSATQIYSTRQRERSGAPYPHRCMTMYSGYFLHRWSR